MPLLSSIYVYPIKSAAGFSLKEAYVEKRGLAHDRRWMLVDAENRFLTQRVHHHMALIRVGLQDGSGLVLNAPGMETLEVNAPCTEAKRISVRVWDDTVDAVVAGPIIDDWFTRFLQTECRLVYMPDDSFRPVNPEYAVGDDYVSFADGYPVLLLSESSLHELNTRLDAPAPMNRFRPNLVIEDCEAHAEDTWEEIRIGRAVFRVVKPCARCVVTTVDQSTGKSSGKEPLRTLAQYRTRKGKVMFGQNLIPVAPGKVQTGDKVEVICFKTDQRR